MKVTIGSDIEWFVGRGDEVVSAEGLIRGTKSDPFHFDGTPYYATQLDNVLAEGNIPPTETEDEFVNNIAYLRGYIDGILPGGYRTLSLAAARLEPKWLQSDTARTFGCSPSLDCWSGIERVPQPSDKDLRSAGFHIHVGYEQPTQHMNVTLARAMEVTLGLTSVLLEPPSDRRCVGYGLAGDYRDQPHGMEYRVLSGYFTDSEPLIRWAFRGAQLAVALAGSTAMDKVSDMGHYIGDAINDGNRRAASRMLRKLDITPHLPEGT